MDFQIGHWSEWKYWPCISGRGFHLGPLLRELYLLLLVFSLPQIGSPSSCLFKSRQEKMENSGKEEGKPVLFLPFTYMKPSNPIFG